MIRPEVLDAMLAAGVSAEHIVAAVKADRAAEEVEAAARRRRAADKKQRQRTRLKAEGVGSADTLQAEENVPGTSGDIGGQEGTYDLKKESPQTPKEKNYTHSEQKPGVREKRPKRAKPVGELCPENLQPNEGHRAKCREAAMPETFADMCCKRLISWSHENTHREIAYKTDWSRALHGMLDKEIEKARVGGNFSTGSKTPSRPERGSPTTAFMKRMEARNVRQQPAHKSPREPAGSDRFALQPDATDEGTGPADGRHRQPTGASPLQPASQGNIRFLRALGG